MKKNVLSALVLMSLCATSAWAMEGGPAERGAVQLPRPGQDGPDDDEEVLCNDFGRGCVYGSVCLLPYLMEYAADASHGLHKESASFKRGCGLGLCCCCLFIFGPVAEKVTSITAQVAQIGVIAPEVVDQMVRRDHQE